jgi:HSP20 family protein
MILRLIIDDLYTYKSINNMAHKTKAHKSTATILQNFQDIDLIKSPVELNYVVNIRETERRYKFEIAAPGFKKDDFNIVTEGCLLTITADAGNTKNAGEEYYTRREFSRPSLSRDFTLPEDALSDHISSKYHNGILSINLKKNNKYLIGEKHVKVD